MTSSIGYYIPRLALQKASFREQSVEPGGEFNAYYATLYTAVAADMKRSDHFHPRFSLVAQVLQPIEGAMMKNKDILQWRHAILSDIHREITPVDEFIDRHLIMDSPIFNPFLGVGKLHLYFQRSDYVFHPRQQVTLRSSIPLNILFTAGTHVSTFRATIHFTVDMGYGQFMDRVINSIQGLNKWPKVVRLIRETSSHVVADFQLFLVRRNLPLAQRSMLRLLYSHDMRPALPTLNWGRDGQEITLSNILGGLDQHEFLITPSLVEADAWMESDDYLVYCQKRRWVDRDGEAYGYTYEGLLTQCTRCVRALGSLRAPPPNGITQPPMGKEVDGPPWDDNEIAEFAHQSDAICDTRESIYLNGRL
jgi:hypothetical protein